MVILLEYFKCLYILIYGWKSMYIFEVLVKLFCLYFALFCSCLNWQFSLVAFGCKKSTAEMCCIFFFSVTCCGKLTFSYSFLKKNAFCLLCFPLLFLHGTLGPKGIRFRSRTRRGNVAKSACSCLHVTQTQLTDTTQNWFLAQCYKHSKEGLAQT